MAHIWKVPISGGEPTLIKGDLPYTPNISPDFRSVAYSERDDAAGTSRLHIASLESGEVRHSIVLTAGAPPDQLKWTPDGKAIMFAMPHNGTLNYWLQPADGSAAKPLTDFRQDIVRGCVFSHDGRDLACVRSSMVRDLVLFKGMFGRG